MQYVKVNIGGEHELKDRLEIPMNFGSSAKPEGKGLSGIVIIYNLKSIRKEEKKHTVRH